MLKQLKKATDPNSGRRLQMKIQARRRKTVGNAR